MHWVPQTLLAFSGCWLRCWHENLKIQLNNIINPQSLLLILLLCDFCEEARSIKNYFQSGMQKWSYWLGTTVRIDIYFTISSFWNKTFLLSFYHEKFFSWLSVRFIPHFKFQKQHSCLFDYLFFFFFCIQIEYILAIGSTQVCILIGDLECPASYFKKVNPSYWNSGVSK